MRAPAAPPAHPAHSTRGHPERGHPEEGHIEQDRDDKSVYMYLSCVSDVYELQSPPLDDPSSGSRIRNIVSKVFTR